MNEFEKWAIDPNGGGWAENPHTTERYSKSVVRLTPKEIWNTEQAAFTAALAIGAQRERDKLRALVEGEIQSVSRGEIFMANTALQLVLNWLTAGNEPETDKTASND